MGVCIVANNSRKLNDQANIIEHQNDFTIQEKKASDLQIVKTDFQIDRPQAQVKRDTGTKIYSNNIIFNDNQILSEYHSNILSPNVNKTINRGSNRTHTRNITITPKSKWNDNSHIEPLVLK